MISDKTISPWAVAAERKSRDGTVTVQFTDGVEVAMGAPTMGTLWLVAGGKKQKLSDRATASFCLSDNSKYLAYCEWTERMKQVIHVIKINGMRCTTIAEELRVVQLESFDDAEITGTDSPMHCPRRFTIALSSIFCTTQIIPTRSHCARCTVIEPAEMTDDATVVSTRLPTGRLAQPP